MKKIKITVNGAEYPAYSTMGALLRFKRETGLEFSEVKPDAPSNMVTYLYCCVKSACAHEGKPLDMELLDFADSITAEDLAAWAESLYEGEGGETAADAEADEKKRG